MLNEREAERQQQEASNIEVVDKGYDYGPLGSGMRPGKDLHDKVRDEVLALAKRAHETVSERFPAWRKMDEVMTAFIPPDEEEELRQQRDPRKPVSIVVPFTYAFYEALSTPMFARYAVEEEIHRFRPIGPEDVITAILGEKVIALQSQHFQELTMVNTAIRDIFTYGICAAHPKWTSELGIRVVKTPRMAPDPMTGEMVPNMDDIMEVEVPSVMFEGNRNYNIDPYRLLTDPNVPFHLVQDGQFAGWSNRTDRYRILEREALDDTYFNGRYLEGQTGLTINFLTEAEEGGGERVFGRAVGEDSDYDTDTLQTADELHMYIRIIPKEWGLEKGSRKGGEVPEKWYFCIIGQEIVAACQPMNLHHQRFPIAVGAPYTDGYSATPLSGLEITYGMQHFANYELNSRVAFIMMAQYGRWAVDRSKVNLKSLVKGKHGKFIEMARMTQGQKVGDYIQQFPVTDVTQGNMGDIMVMHDWMQRVTGATDPLQGVMRQTGERRSATEARGAKMGAMGRIDKISRLLDDQFMGPLGYLMLAQTAQFMSKDTFVRIAGRHEEALRAEFGQTFSGEGFPSPEAAEFFPVEPGDLAGHYDVAPTGRSFRGEDMFEGWVQLWGMIVNNPILIQNLDIFRIFKHIARLGGADNVSDFVRQGGGVNPQMMPDEQVRGQVQKGNLVPVGGANRG